MRLDQYERLQKLEEELTEVFLGEADSKRWPGLGIEPANMDRDTRGDRYWCKKNAVATMSLIVRVTHLIGHIQSLDTTPPPESDDSEAVDHLDAEIASAEKEATKLLDRMARRAES